MSYKDIPLPDGLRMSVQRAFHLPLDGVGTLGHLVEVTKETLGAPCPEDLIPEVQTRHRIKAGGRTFYTNCFVDALMLPFVLGEAPIEVESESPTGEVVRAVVTTAGVRASIPEAVVSFGAARAGEGPFQATCCPYMNAFPSQASYERWATETPQAVTIPLALADAFSLARDLVRGAQPSSGWNCVGCAPSGGGASKG